jgi:hypothetical protein
MFRSNSFITLFLFFLLSLSLPTNCYEIFQSSFPKLHPEKSFSQDQGIKISIQAFTHQECIHFFKTNLIKKGFRPLIMHIENKTLNTYRFSHFKSSLTNSSLSLAPIKKIAQGLNFNILLLTSTTFVASLALYAQFIPVILAATFAMMRYNTAITTFLEKNCFDDAVELKILPYQTVSKLIFFHESEFTSNFEINFLEETKKLITFNVDLLHYIPHLPHLTLV